MELITSEQRDELITTFVERDAFHLELKDTYATAIEDGPFAQWLKGEPNDLAWLQPWQTRIRNATQTGKTVRRVRVISEPITDYIRWEHAITDRAVIADCIRVRDQLWAIALPHDNYEPV